MQTEQRDGRTRHGERQQKLEGGNRRRDTREPHTGVFAKESQGLRPGTRLNLFYNNNMSFRFSTFMKVIHDAGYCCIHSLSEDFAAILYFDVRLPVSVRLPVRVPACTRRCLPVRVGACLYACLPVRLPA